MKRLLLAFYLISLLLTTNVAIAQENNVTRPYIRLKM